jgi:hypothetical protein
MTFSLIINVNSASAASRKHHGSNCVMRRQSICIDHCSFQALPYHASDEKESLDGRLRGTQEKAEQDEHRHAGLSNLAWRWACTCDARWATGRSGRGGLHCTHIHLDAWAPACSANFAATTFPCTHHGSDMQDQEATPFYQLMDGSFCM